MTVRAPSWRLVTLSSTCPPRTRRCRSGSCGHSTIPRRFRSGDAAHSTGRARGETVRVKGRLTRKGDQQGEARRLGHRELSVEASAETSPETPPEVPLEVKPSLEVDLRPASAAQSTSLPSPVARLVAAPGRAGRLLHVRSLPGRPGTVAGWPAWVEPAVITALRQAGIDRPWRHQVEAAEAAWAARHGALATGTAAGQSLGYLWPALSAVVAGDREPGARGATALYLAPTKALAADQLAAVGRVAGGRGW